MRRRLRVLQETVTRHTHPMTHPELVRTAPGVKPGKRKQRAWLAGGLAVPVTGISIAVTLAFWHPGRPPWRRPRRSPSADAPQHLCGLTTQRKGPEPLRWSADLGFL
jgi:hypothetical protein